MKEDQKVHVLQVHDIVSHVDGYWLRHYATDFLAAAQVFEAPKNRFSPVKYYLVCHSIELSLKSFLFSVAFKKKHRKQLGHDLDKALIVAEENGLGSHLVIAQTERETLQKANKLYLKKEFEYFESLETIYDPYDFDLDLLMSFAQKILEAIKKPVMESITE